MNTVYLTNFQIQNLHECITNGRMGQGIIYASASLLLYDYCLTVWDEVRYIWRRPMSISSSAFIIARYGAMAGIILTIVPNLCWPVENSLQNSLQTAAGILRFLSVVASEFIVAVRTWAIWNRSRRILIALTIFSLATMIPTAVIVGERISLTRVVPLAIPEFEQICSLAIGDITARFIVPYIMVIFYECVNLTFTLIQIVRWRRTIPENVRAPIIDYLWRDGIIHFLLMLVLGLMNTGIVLQQVPQVRSGGSQLQAVFQSILSTRIVLHLARSRDSRDITAPGCSVYQSSGGIQFTSVYGASESGIRTTASGMELAILS
ncbi:hypothetical protein BDP27DRAFT_654958 [Rhodocollybia butyracea]|uniref:DUF6533 domain-containing protein n=1 Tax=Rhodocollybia butyracea TaxID=206335 RepID=A0A9P5PV99_9AGAR|nr:hypothetical protein BDP27DRAFT_654958 [Rhodocollybia butyracea]